MLIASTGHSSTQVPHSVQVSGSTFAVSSTEIASTGHTSAHAPHPVQASSSTFAGIVLPPLSILEFLNESEKNVNKKI